MIGGIVIKIKRDDDNLGKNSNVQISDIQYKAMTPVTKIENGDEYFRALDWALKQNDIKNIAVSGPYGSGKSSVIESFLQKHKEIVPLRISMATFNLNEMLEGLNDDAGLERYEEKLEIGILKQLFYSIGAEKIPESRYRKLIPENKLKNLMLAAILEILVALLLHIIFPNSIKGVIDFLQSQTQINFGFFYLLLFIIGLPISTEIVRWMGKNKNVQEVSVGNLASVKTNEDNAETIFNRNMDEIVYFFERTKYAVVIIEDLDRFKSTEIFVALREINSILNNYEKIKGKVSFVYAIKDDMFTEAEERTKFFDFIIPIVPYISSVNSGEILRERLLFDDKEDKSSVYDIDGRYISLVSPYISDMRALVCICNEFKVFKNTLKTGQGIGLVDKNIMSLIIFKNLYPKEFADIENETSDSFMKTVFDSKYAFIEKKIKNIEQERKKESQVLSEIEKETMSDIKELKICLLTQLTKNTGIVYRIIVDGNDYSLEKLLSDDFDVELLWGDNATLYYSKYGLNTNRSVSNLREEVENLSGNYIERIKRQKEGLEKCKQEAKKQIENYENKINSLRTWSIKDIISEFGVEFLSEDIISNDLFVFMLRNGFIDENYSNCINYFHPNSITKDEMNYILGIRNHRWNGDYSYPLEHIKQIVDRLQDYEFEQKEVLNYVVVDYILKERLQSSYAEHLFKQVANHTQESISFIKAYFTRGENTGIFIKKICEQDRSFWNIINTDEGIPLDTQYKYLYSIFENVDVNNIVELDIKSDADVDCGVISDFIISHPDVLKKMNGISNERIIQIQKALGVIYTDVDLDGVNIEIVEDIFENSRYELMPVMIKRLFQWKLPENVSLLSSQCYTEILKLEYAPLLGYAHDNFEVFVENNILAVDTNINETSDAISDILERLINNQEMCYAILDKEIACWNDISECCGNVTNDNLARKRAIWNYLLDNKRIVCSWENFINYFEVFGNTECWVNYFDANADQLLCIIANIAIPYELLMELLFAEISIENFKKLILCGKYELYNDSLECLSVDKIRLMIDAELIPFTIKYWQQLDSISPDLKIDFAKKNRKEFLESLDDIELSEQEIIKLFLDDEFTFDSKKEILAKSVSMPMSVELARAIKIQKYPVDREFVDRAWDILPDEDKYELLLNQIDQYEDQELPELFIQLAEVYHVFSERKKRKYTLDYTDYNKKLTDKLHKRDYLSSADESWEKTGGIFNNNQRHIITGYVKQAK